LNDSRVELARLTYYRRALFLPNNEAVRNDPLRQGNNIADPYLETDESPPPAYAHPVEVGPDVRLAEQVIIPEPLTTDLQNDGYARRYWVYEYAQRPGAFFSLAEPTTVRTTWGDIKATCWYRYYTGMNGGRPKVYVHGFSPTRGAFTDNVVESVTLSEEARSKENREATGEEGFVYTDMGGPVTITAADELNGEQFVRWATPNPLWFTRGRDLEVREDGTGWAVALYGHISTEPEIRVPPFIKPPELWFDITEFLPRIGPLMERFPRLFKPPAPPSPKPPSPLPTQDFIQIIKEYADQLDTAGRTLREVAGSLQDKVSETK